MYKYFKNKSYQKKAFVVYLIILFFALLNFLAIILTPIMINSSGFFSDLAVFLYALYSKSCHQIKERTFFIFGAYLPVCVRCFSIYTGFLLGCFSFPFIRKFNFFNFPKLWIFFIAVVMIIIDVGFHLVGLLENSFITRVITGGFIGFVSAFFIIPAFVNAFYEILYFYKQKKINTNDKPA